jgi:hypothetical protein
MSSEYGGLEFQVKTRKDKYYDELKQLAKTIEVNDVNLVLAEKTRSNYQAFEVKENVNVHNKFELAKKVRNK